MRRNKIFIFVSSLLLALFLFSCSNPYYDQPPLHEAAKRGNLKQVKLLIQQGINVNAKNREGATPLHWAAFKGRVDIVKYLLAHGARVNAETKKGSTPLKLAKEHHQEEVAKILKSRGGQ